ncbi:TonB C-terminal domain-containing protein [Campylobacter sp. 19-13652]|uniref:TonB C-terminal domain-containing protein n=1 Tax=Campylobacter sp. 19-13652 TaxID=2840180 RepID=UPI001C7471E8|nr:TonB C-terminal domain-containing protein [Campylobacter sp. 19-13652]BCX78951.1 hypothetical protein LBC_04130 [Campylobacter sp. 19-13652]
MPRFPTISSFFVAIFIYIALVFGIFFALLDSNERAKKYTDDKDAFMDVIIDLPEVSPEITQSKKSEELKDEIKQDTSQKEPEILKDEPKPELEIPKLEPLPPKPQEQPKPQEIPEPKLEEPKEQKPDLKELFGSIDTTKFKPEPKPKPQPKEKPQKPSNEASKIVNSLKLDKSAKAPKSQKTGIYNPLYGAIEKQIQRKWQSYKADSNNEAKVRVSIDANGRFSYEIIALPYDETFNSKVKECLQALTLETFAHGSSVITLDLTLVDKLFR